MTHQLRHERINHGQTSVFARKWKQAKGNVGYIRPSMYIKTPTRVWSVISTPLNHGMMKHADHFLQGAHAVSWLLELTKKGDTLDEQTWQAINTAAPEMIQQFRDRTGQDWKPEAEQAQLF